jgi:isoleucyl-tRNA synthetase
LYTVLVNLTKLFAPVMPFLAEVMYQSLVVHGAGQRTKDTGPPESVHLCAFPEVDESLIDTELSADMTALLRLVAMGSAARNMVKIKVRQPLAEMKVQPAHESDRRAVNRFADQICDELNFKKVSLHDPERGPLVKHEVRLNTRNAGPKFGPRLQEVEAAVAAGNQEMLVKKFLALRPIELLGPNGTIILEQADLIIGSSAVEEGWAGGDISGTQVVIDCRITDELKQEGFAREVVRHVQSARKDAGLEMDDRIVLYLGTESPEFGAAIKVHEAYIGAETLTAQWAAQPLDGAAHQAKVKVDGQPLMIELRKAQGV